MDWRLARDPDTSFLYAVIEEGTAKIILRGISLADDEVDVYRRLLLCRNLIDGQSLPLGLEEWDPSFMAQQSAAILAAMANILAGLTSRFEIPPIDDLSAKASTQRFQVITDLFVFTRQARQAELIAKARAREEHSAALSVLDFPAAPVSVGGDLQEVGRPPLVQASQEDLEALSDLAEAAADALGDPEGAAS